MLESLAKLSNILDYMDYLHLFTLTSKYSWLYGLFTPVYIDIKFYNN